MIKKTAAAMLAAIGLAGCAGFPGVTPPPADPAVIAKINYVCAYSGLFKFADNFAASVIPVPGVALGVNLINAGIDRICLYPEEIAATEATVIALIDQFKAAGKM